MSTTPDNRGWISVKDSLPEEGVDVLVAIDTGPEPTDWACAVMHRYQHFRWDGYARTITDDYDPDGLGETVTHWRPLGFIGWPGKEGKE